MNEFERAIIDLSVFGEKMERNEIKTALIKAVHLAIQALQEKLERENPQPLTIEQLQKLDKQAVFCVDTKRNGKWALVHMDNEMCTDATYGDWEFYEYGHNSPYGWKAYRYKPKKEHVGEANDMVEGE